MKYLKIILFVLIAPLLLLTNCNDDDNNINDPLDFINDSYNNIPVIVNVEQSYTFTVIAKNFTYSTEDILNNFTDSVLISLTLNNFVTSTNSSIKLMDDKNEDIYKEELNSNKVVVSTKMDLVVPKKVKIELVDFTGQLTISIVPYKP